MQPPYKTQRDIGTAELEWAWLAAGRVNLLVHGSKHIWDYAAGVLLNDEAGGFSEALEGEPVYQLSLESRSVIAASHPELFAKCASVLRDIDQPNTSSIL